MIDIATDKNSGSGSFLAGGAKGARAAAIAPALRMCYAAAAAANSKGWDDSTATAAGGKTGESSTGGKIGEGSIGGFGDGSIGGKTGKSPGGSLGNGSRQDEAGESATKCLDNGGRQDCAGILPSGAAASTVIYLGDARPDVDKDAVYFSFRNAGGAKAGEVASESDVTELKSRLFNEIHAKGFSSLSVYIDGAGLFACGQSIEEALYEGGRILYETDAAYEGPHSYLNRSRQSKYDAKQEGGQSFTQGSQPGLEGGQSLPLGSQPGPEGSQPGPKGGQSLPLGSQPGPEKSRGPDSGSLHAYNASRLKGKIALVTGAAQGFGRGIAEELAAEGAYVCVADLNYEGAAKCAGELTRLYGAGRAVAVGANVADEESVAAMVNETVLAYGGLDLFISNAGVLIAGALPDMKKEQFDLVTSVNYTGYFLGVKHASVPMKTQRAVCGSYAADIIEINSKSGLEGSNKNFAYAGSKFGGVGLTQSFALELVEYGIKVNAICPGNFLDGPLWSDPERGLFRQYLEAGKVPGAKTTADVRRYYESRVPMKRGCTVKDVARAIFYLIEQEYETGQALPVTGGQVMLN